MKLGFSLRSSRMGIWSRSHYKRAYVAFFLAVFASMAAAVALNDMPLMVVGV